MGMSDSEVRKVLELVRRAGIMRPRDLKPHGLPVSALWELHRRGLLQRLGRGLYALPGADITEHHALAEACKRVPHAVICLLSALRFHDLTTQAPFEIWIAIGPKARRPKAGNVPLRIMTFSGRALRAGVEERTVEGVMVKVYSAAKTVADCFKFRNKIGRDVAIEALRDCLAQRKCTNDELWRHAKTCRVANVMRPYIEAVV